MLYCSREHQMAHRDDHKLACNAVKRWRDHLENEEQSLRALPADDGFTTSADVFDIQVGRFWRLFETRDYMRSRFRTVDALGRVGTFDAIQAALDHALDMQRLSRTDNMGVRELIPSLFLRLGRDQDCYDFIKWHQTMGRDDDYDWGDMSAPFLHIKNANAFESIEYMCGKYPDLCHTSAATLIKIKLLVDLKSLQNSAVLDDQVPADLVKNIQRYVPQSTIISSNKQMMIRSNGASHIEELSAQVDLLYATVNKANQHFWRALVDPKHHLKAPPQAFSHGSIEQMQLILQYSINAWMETPGALEIIKAKVQSDSYVSPRHPASGIFMTRSGLLL